MNPVKILIVLCAIMAISMPLAQADPGMLSPGDFKMTIYPHQLEFYDCDCLCQHAFPYLNDEPDCVQRCETDPDFKMYLINLVQDPSQCYFGDVLEMTQVDSIPDDNHFVDPWDPPEPDPPFIDPPDKPIIDPSDTSTWDPRQPLDPIDPPPDWQLPDHSIKCLPLPPDPIDIERLGPC